MANISFMLYDLIEWNTGFWGTLIGWFNSFIQNYGWTIIVFTIILKLILSPLDYMQRRAGAKNAIQQAKLQPELDKIKQRYANNPEKMKAKLNEKQMEFMRSGQMKMGSTCGIMLIYLAVTLVVFLTLFYSMQGIANIQTVNSYIQFENKYTAEYNESSDEVKAQQAVYELYKSGEATESWLWIDNIWKSDTSTSVVSSYEEFQNIAKNVKDCPYSFEEGKENYLSKEQYEKVMAQITSETQGKWNGYYILIVLCGVVSFLTYQITALGNKKRSGAGAGSPQMPNVGNLMKWILPAIMIAITLFYSSAFALYILANSLFTLAAIPVYNAILNKTTKNISGNSNNGNNSSNGINVDYKINKVTKIEE